MRGSSTQTVANADDSMLDGDAQGSELESEIADMLPLRRHVLRYVLYIAANVVTAGLLALAAHWFTDWERRLTLVPCSPAAAELMFVKLRDGRSALCKVHSRQGADDSKLVRLFVFHTQRFLWSHSAQSWQAVPEVPSFLSGEIKAAKTAVMVNSSPCSPVQEVRLRRSAVFGDNLLDVHVPSFLTVFARDALQPFYCFQYMSVIIWGVESYWTYSIVVFVITMTSIITNTISQHTERKRMAEMAHHVTPMKLLHASPTDLPPSAQQQHEGPHAAGTQPPAAPPAWVTVPSSVLLPGDVVVVEEGKLACDIVLLEGECVVDETVLTGESIPVRKVALDLELDMRQGSYRPDACAHCTLFNGTLVAAARGGGAGRPALGLVVATGFSTAKGRLLRSIMFPRQQDLGFVRQALYFIALMLVMATAFYIWDVVALVRFNAPPSLIVIKAFDMITTAVPPALACCLAIATTISTLRLKAQSVHVLDSERVPLAGLLDAICFDKTGTLTDIGLELKGVMLAAAGRFSSLEEDPSQLPCTVHQLFATCHGLTVLGTTADRPARPHSPRLAADPDAQAAAGPGQRGRGRLPVRDGGGGGEEGAPALTGAKGAGGESLGVGEGAGVGAGAGAGAAWSGGRLVGDPLEQRLFEASRHCLSFEEELPGPWALALTRRSGGEEGGPGAGPRAAAAAPPLSAPYLLVAPVPVMAASWAAGGAAGLAPPQPALHAPVPSPPADSGALTLTHFDATRRADAAGHAELATRVGREVSQSEGVGRGGDPSEPLLLAPHPPPPTSPPAPEAHKAAVHGGVAEGGGNRGGGGEGGHGSCGEWGVGGAPGGLGGQEQQQQQRRSLREKLLVLRRFDFTSERLRSSAVVLRPDGRVQVFVKGSPEKLQGLVDPSSLPPDFTRVLQGLTDQGLRVIGIASKEVRGLSSPAEVLTASQETLEAGAQFLGLVLMVNRLKPESAPTIEHLHSAAIRTAMVTGDHVRTAITVARQCAILDAATPCLIVDLDHQGTVQEAAFRFEVVDPAAPLPSSTPIPTTHLHAPRLPAAAAAAAAGWEAAPPVPGGAAAAGVGAGAAGQGAPGHALLLSQHEAVRLVASGAVALAVTGRAWQKLQQEGEQGLLLLVVQRGRVFARMNPEDKRSLVEQLGFGEVDAAGAARPGAGHYTGYCGDGANDLGALKSALVGVSLCDAEASIAAPMSSRIPHIGVMVQVVAEGRCSLVTSLIIFKYAMVYAYIQVLSLALLYNMGLTVGNYQYLLQDLFHTTLLATCMGLTRPATRLSAERPLSRVLSLGVILPVVGQLVVVTAFQVFTLTSLKQQDWYTAFDPSSHPPLDIAVSERQAATGALFITGCWQLIIMALVFNVGRPFRREIWTNSWLMASLLGLVAFNLYVTWAPGDPFRRRVPAVIDLPIHYRRVLAFIAISTLCIAYATDMVCTCLYQYCKKEWSRTRAGSRPKAERRAEGAALGIGPAHTAAPPPVARQQLELPMQHLLPAAGHAPRSDAV